MSMTVAQTLLVVAGTYTLVGLVFAFAFVFAGVHRIDSGAEGAGFFFRLIILPGAVALWPLLALRWLGGRKAPTECNPHRQAAATRAKA